MKQKFYVFLICLTISVFVWLLVVLSNESLTSIDYPITYKSIPEEYILVNKPDSILSFRVSSGGFELFTLKYLTRKNPIEIDLENIDITRTGDYFESEYPTSTITRNIIRNLNLSEELVSIEPQSINFKFEALIGKEVKVIPDLRLKFEKQFQLADSLFVKPETIMILGPKDEIEQIEFVKTEVMDILNINESTSVDALIASIDNFPHIRFVPNEVIIGINVEKYTESIIEVPVVPETGNDIQVKIFPEKITITYLVSLDNFKRVNSDNFVATVKLPDPSSEVSKLKVDLLQYPSYINVTKIEPEEVEFLFLKK